MRDRFATLCRVTAGQTMVWMMLPVWSLLCFGPPLLRPDVQVMGSFGTLREPAVTATFVPTTLPQATTTATPTPRPLPTVDQNGDSDFDGIADAIECRAVDACVDSDADGQVDYLDIDSDNDGIPDRVEAVVVAVVERSVRPVDLDGDGIPDYLDEDSDNDTLYDRWEGHDANLDGVADRVALGSDHDQDGLDDAFDTVDGGHSRLNAAGSNASLPSSSGGLPNWRNADDDGDGIPTIEEIGHNRAFPVDEDDNGVPDYLQPRQLRYWFLPVICQ